MLEHFYSYLFDKFGEKKQIMLSIPVHSATKIYYSLRLNYSIVKWRYAYMVTPLWTPDYN